MTSIAPPVRTDAEGLAALLVLRPTHASRNRHFALFATPEAKLARRHALALRGLVRDLAGGHGPVRVTSCAPVDGHADSWSLGYTLVRIAARRTVELTTNDLAVVRVALARRGLRLLPAALVVRDDDHAIVARLIRRGESSLGLAASEPSRDHH